MNNWIAIIVTAVLTAALTVWLTRVPSQAPTMVPPDAELRGQIERLERLVGQLQAQTSKKGSPGVLEKGKSDYTKEVMQLTREVGLRLALTEEEIEEMSEVSADYAEESYAIFAANNWRLDEEATKKLESAIRRLNDRVRERLPEEKRARYDEIVSELQAPK